MMSLDFREKVAICCLVVILGLVAWGCSSATQVEASAPMAYRAAQIDCQFREFRNAEELIAWRDERIFYVNDKPFLSLLTIGDYSPKKDCDDVAETWQRQALDDGYLMSMQLIKRGWIGNKRISKARGWHMACLTIIGNDVYIIDTYPPYKVIKVGVRDKEDE